MDRISFITATGFLTAILLVWSQLWTTTAQVYEESGTSMWIVKYSLVYLYWAIFASLVAFALAVFREPMPKPALGLLGFSLTTSIFMIGSSLVGVIMKVLNDLSLWSTLEPWPPLYNLSLGYGGKVLLVIVFPMLVLTAWILAIYHLQLFQN